MSQLCLEHGISSATFYKWRSKFGGADASLMSQLKELLDENWRPNIALGGITPMQKLMFAAQAHFCCQLSGGLPLTS